MKRLALFSWLATASGYAMAAGFSVEGLISLVIWLVIVGLIMYLLWWFVGYVGLPAPFDKVVRVLIGLVALIILLYLLLGLLGPLPRL